MCGRGPSLVQRPISQLNPDSDAMGGAPTQTEVDGPSWEQRLDVYNSYNDDRLQAEAGEDQAQPAGFGRASLLRGLAWPSWAAAPRPHLAPAIDLDKKEAVFQRNTIVGGVVETLESVYVGNLKLIEGPNKTLSDLASLVEQGVLSMLVVPISVLGESLGCILLGAETVDRFSIVEQVFVRGTASVLATAIHLRRPLARNNQRRGHAASLLAPSKLSRAGPGTSRRRHMGSPVPGLPGKMFDMLKPMHGALTKRSQSLQNPSLTGHSLPSIVLTASGCLDAITEDDDNANGSSNSRAASPEADVLGRLLRQTTSPKMLRRCMSAGLAVVPPAPPPETEAEPTDDIVYAEWHESVTVLFTDIVGFTDMANQVTPDKVMGMLHQLFTRFDRLCEKHRLYKVETIGDCYMVAAGLIHKHPNHARAMVVFAEELLHTASSVIMPTGQCVRVRVGVHSGTVMSGIVGQIRPRYCLFGDTVNTASRMESTGIPGRIHISHDTLQMLGPHWRAWESRGDICVKGKGHMRTFLLADALGATNAEAAKPQPDPHLTIFNRPFPSGTGSASPFALADFQLDHDARPVQAPASQSAPPGIAAQRRKPNGSLGMRIGSL
ncbi:hypothetical protein WJX72_002888 [[Myrmecia] bisecta]|uniref:Guanylate cyclase domain-containing protein n=1 Tax=[Myrmecia] bisecta TaxID=41462 RepID=A0AAW1QQU8_9CHLO